MQKRIYMRLLLTLSGGFFYFFSGQVQNFDDWEARPAVSVKYSPDDNWTFTGTYYLYLDEDISHYKKSVYYGGVGYQFNSWFNVDLGYKYGARTDKSYNEYRFSTTFSHAFDKHWKIKYRPMYNLRRTNSTTENYLRNRIKLRYKFNKKVQVYVLTDNYQYLDNGIGFDRQKSALGAKFKIHKKHHIDPRLYVINKRKKHKDIGRIAVKYIYILK